MGKKKKRITTKEIEDALKTVMKELEEEYKEEDVGFGLVKVTLKDLVFIINANSFHKEILKKLRENND